MLRLAIKMTALVKTKLSGSVLKVRSGRLRRSINYKINKSARNITATVGTNVIYGKVHELGLTIPAHIVEAKKAKALKFVMGGKTMFRKRVNIPAVKMPQRSFLQTSLAQMQPTIRAELEAALTRGIKEGLGK